jgi:spore germination protein YaaH
LILLGACGSTTPVRPTGSGPGAGSAPPSRSASNSNAPSGGFPTASPAGSPTSSATPSPSFSPGVTATPFGYGAKGLSHEVMAFLTSGYVAREADTLDYGSISTVVEFGIEAGANGGLVKTLAGRVHPKWAAWISPSMDRVIAHAHAAGSKVVPSIIRFSWSPAETAISRALLANPTARARLISESVAEIVRRGVDGVNLDFEPVPVGQRANYTALVRGFRAALDAIRPGYQLTVAVTGYYQSYDLKALVAPGAADAIYLMGYHYRGTFSKSAGSTSPMGGPTYDVVDTILAFQKVGIPAGKIILGVPFYGHLWPTAGPAINARTTGPGRDVLYREGIALDATYGASYDPVEGVMWGEYQARTCPACPLTWWQFYVDNATTLRRKWAYVNDHGLLGTGLWAVGYEGDHLEPWIQLRTTFLK